MRQFLIQTIAPIAATVIPMVLAYLMYWSLAALAHSLPKPTATSGVRARVVYNGVQYAFANFALVCTLVKLKPPVEPANLYKPEDDKLTPSS